MHDDGDGDGFDECSGDCNDANDTISPKGAEELLAGNCHDGADNDCSGNADCADLACQVPPAAYRFGRLVTVTPQPALSQGFGIFITFNHAALVTAGKSAANGSDVRVFLRDSGGFHERPRETAVASGWNKATTVIVVANDRDRSAADTDLLLVYGAGSAIPAPADEATSVYTLRDDFSGSGPPAGWTQTGDPVAEATGYLYVPAIDPASNVAANPVASRTFKPISGRLELTVQLYVIDAADEVDYGTFFWLGKDLTAPGTTVKATKAAVLLGWGDFPGGGAASYGRNHFMGGGGTGPTFVDHGAGTGLHTYRVVIDTNAHTLSATLDGVAKTGPVFGDTSINDVNTFRVAGWKVAHIEVLYDFVGLRRLPAAEATTSLGPELTMGPCP
jgi:hypothetical protein